MKVIGKNILIKNKEEKLQTTKSGLLLGEKQREDIRYKNGVIVLPGNEVNIIKTGDEIYFDRHAGFTLEVNKELYTVIQEKDIVIIL